MPCRRSLNKVCSCFYKTRWVQFVNSPFSSSFQRAPTVSPRFYCDEWWLLWSFLFSFFSFFCRGKMWETRESPFEFEWEERFAADKEFLFVSFFIRMDFLGGGKWWEYVWLWSIYFFVRIFVFLEVSYQRQNSRVKLLGEWPGSRKKSSWQLIFSQTTSCATKERKKMPNLIGWEEVALISSTI